MITLPEYAYEYHHPANRDGDVAASFYDDTMHGTITVSIQQDIEHGEKPKYFMLLSRSGCAESTFSGGELAKVLEVAGCLAKHVGIVPRGESTRPAVEKVAG